MKRSEVEKDVFFILESLKEKDYEIPSNKQILGVLFRKIWLVYALQLIMVILDCYLYSSEGVMFPIFFISSWGCCYFHLDLCCFLR